MTSEHRDPYVVLGVARQASAAEIARAFRRAARETHPDATSAGAGSAERFRAVSDAYETLRDPERRQAYDRAHPRLRRGASNPATRWRRVGYAVPGGQHIVLGAASDVQPAVRAGDVEVVPPARAASLSPLVLTLLRRHW